MRSLWHAGCCALAANGNAAARRRANVMKLAAPSLDRLVGEASRVTGTSESERIGGPEIDRHSYFTGACNGEISWLFAFGEDYDLHNRPRDGTARPGQGRKR